MYAYEWLTLQRFANLVVIFCLFETLGHDAQKLLEVDDSSVCNKPENTPAVEFGKNQRNISGDVNAM